MPVAETDNPQPERTEFDEIPVNELIRITREFTRRITNQDRQRLGMDLRESGHSRNLQINAPITLQQFFSGEIDLDSDLARRFVNAPLLSSARFVGGSAEGTQRQQTGIFSSNDDAAIMSVDAHTHRGEDATLEFTFTLYSALALRFRLSPLVTDDRRRWIELMRRASGIAFLWTRERWEQPYLVFVVRDYFVRLYGFSPHGFEAAVRLTPGLMTSLLDWLEGLWFPGHPAGDADQQAAAPPEERPTLPQRASRLEQAYRAAVPDAPEEQWADDQPPADAEIDAPAQPEVRSDLSPGDLDW